MSKYWQVDLGATTYGSAPLTKSASKAFFDTGTSFNLLPRYDLERIMLKLGRPFNTQHKLQHFECKDSYFIDNAEDIHFQIDGQTYTIPVAQWLQRDKDVCTVKFMWDSKEKKNWILGLNFFQEYEVLFDLDGNRVGLKKISGVTK